MFLYNFILIDVTTTKEIHVEEAIDQPFGLQIQDGPRTVLTTAKSSHLESKMKVRELAFSDSWKEKINLLPVFLLPIRVQKQREPFRVCSKEK